MEEIVDKILICPDCKSGIHSVKMDDRIICLYCGNCQLSFPVKDGVYILLPRNARNTDLELHLLQDIRNTAVGAVAKLPCQ